MENPGKYLLCTATLIVLLCSLSLSYEDDNFQYGYQDGGDDNAYNVDASIDGGIAKRPFGRLFGPTWSMSKRPFGSLFGPYPSMRAPKPVYRTMRAKRPFGRMFGPSFATGKRSHMDVSKRPFGRMFGPGLMGKRSDPHWEESFPCGQDSDC